jgi:hypothetical protein
MNEQLAEIKRQIANGTLTPESLREILKSQSK